MVTPHRLADASSFVLMTDSLLHDGDLRYERADLERARALHFDDAPAGLMLVKDARGDYAYGKPALYPIVALPWYALLGVRGFLALNGLLLGALAVLGADLLAPMLGWRRAALVAAGVYALSVVPAYVGWIDPFLLLCTLVASGLAAHHRGRPVLAGAASAAAAMYRFPYAVLLAVPLRAGRGGAAGRVAAGACLVALATATVTHASIGQWSPTPAIATTTRPRFRSIRPRPKSVARSRATGCSSTGSETDAAIVPSAAGLNTDDRLLGVAIQPISRSLRAFRGTRSRRRGSLPPGRGGRRAWPS